MKIGDRVRVIAEHNSLRLLFGKVGTIVSHGSESRPLAGIRVILVALDADRNATFFPAELELLSDIECLAETQTL